MSLNGKPILVTGATGNTGSPLVELLTQRGAPVRVMVRHQAAAPRFQAPSVQVAVADFDDPDSLAAAVAGVARAYLVTPEDGALTRRPAEAIPCIVPPRVRTHPLDSADRLRMSCAQEG
jgi:uncharacterized protein YbjT (DUF2867 family)